MAERIYLKRKIDSMLFEWSKTSDRKPILLRGARQVGKSSAVRELSKKFDYFLEINFEEHQKAKELFTGDLAPKQLIENLSLLFSVPIIPGKTLLFFDEIQACIPAISSLRFFYEKLPELHLIAAGSLLEFALEELPSFGVGRVRSVFMYPFSFDEFLWAINETELQKIIRKTNVQNPLAEPVHQKLINNIKRFLVLGGMPEVIQNYVIKKDLTACQDVLNDLVISLKADFSKYKNRVPSSRISEVFESAVEQMGTKFMYSNLTSQFNHKQIKEAIELLIMAGLIIPVTHSSSNGIPLGAEKDPKKRKLLILDTGILQRLLNLKISDLILENDFDLINKGAIAELFVGLEILKSYPATELHELFYWQRETASSNAEVDYVIQHQQIIKPIEVKSGKKGSMQSMFQFLKEKNYPVGIRFSLENFANYQNIEVMPLYAVSKLIEES